MRNFLKKQLLNLFSTLEQAEQLLVQIEQNGKAAQAGVLMRDMQESAMALGNAIERSEGREITAVSALEAYRGLLWQRVNEASPAQKEDIINKLAVTRKHAYDCICQDVPVKYEIVFLPYKASMWDSLESIWMAARDDPDCDCHVVPIPYFDRKSDGTFGDIHYEGNQYPDYVPITDYQKFNMMDAKPEAVFIHNPYDECNMVTSIHPAFYTKELLRCTDLLVYIPYFIVSDNIPEHFCLLPGVLNSTYTIVQSEQVRCEYLNAIRGAAGLTETQFKESAYLDKIIALGSPKIDGVLLGKRTWDNIPQAWKEIMDAN